MARELHIIVHGLTTFVKRGHQLEICIARRPTLPGFGGESFHAILLTEQSTTAVPLHGALELCLDRVVSPSRAMLRGAEGFLRDGEAFDAEEMEIEGRMLVPVPDVVATARYEFHQRAAVLGREGASIESLQPTLAYILSYGGVERAQLRTAGRMMWELPMPLIPGVQTDRYVGPVFLPN